MQYGIFRTAFRLSKKLTQIFPRKRKTKFKTFCVGACTWYKLLIRLQVWNLFGMDEQIMRAADCRKLAEKPEGVFRQAQCRTEFSVRHFAYSVLPNPLNQKRSSKGFFTGSLYSSAAMPTGR